MYNMPLLQETNCSVSNILGSFDKILPFDNCNFHWEKSKVELVWINERHIIFEIRGMYSKIPCIIDVNTPTYK